MTKMKNKYIIALLLLFNCQFSMVSAQRVMTLAECVDAARKSNTTAKDAQHDIQMAREQQKLARSKYFPSLSATALHFESFFNRKNQQLKTIFK